MIKIQNDSHNDSHIMSYTDTDNHTHTQFDKHRHNYIHSMLHIKTYDHDNKRKMSNYFYNAIFINNKSNTMWTLNDTYKNTQCLNDIDTQSYFLISQRLLPLKERKIYAHNTIYLFSSEHS